MLQVALIVSLNLHRRHQDEGQRALQAARLANMKQGERTDLLQNCERLSQSASAELLHVSPRSVASARDVINYGVPELVRAVEQGQVAVSTAAELTELFHKMVSQFV
jgi:hypothetical protein